MTPNAEQNWVVLLDISNDAQGDAAVKLNPCVSGLQQKYQHRNSSCLTYNLCETIWGKKENILLPCYKENEQLSFRTQKLRGNDPT